MCACVSASALWQMAANMARLCPSRCGSTSRGQEAEILGNTCVLPRVTLGRRANISRPQRDGGTLTVLPDIVFITSRFLTDIRGIPPPLCEACQSTALWSRAARPGPTWACHGPLHRRTFPPPWGCLVGAACCLHQGKGREKCGNGANIPANIVLLAT